jgi:ABC-type transporter Mla subunit MlaD
MSGALVGIGLFLMILVCFALVAVAEVTRRQRRRTVAVTA